MGKEPLTFEQATWLTAKLIRTFTSLALTCLGILLLGISMYGFTVFSDKTGFYGIAGLGVSLGLCGVLILPNKPDVSDFYKELAKAKEQQQEESRQ